jgi:hypothetical protein
MQQEPSPPIAALLWDLDNVAPGRAHLGSLALAISGLVRPDAPRIAAGHRYTYGFSAGPLQALGIQVLSGGRRRNGADRVLLNQATALWTRGVERFLVASNDHRFARIAAFADLHVITLDESGLSMRLRDQAQSVTVFRRGDDGWLRLSASTPSAIPG